MYIVLEGIDGSGKTTLRKKLAATLGFKECFTPTADGEVGKLLRRTFTGEVVLDKRALTYLFIADALDHEHRVLRPLLEAGEDVISDRHCMVSSWAYQTEAYPLDALLGIVHPSQFIKPSITILLDVDPETAVARIKARGEALNPMYETNSVARLQRMRHAYLAYASVTPQVVVVDGSNSEDEVLAVVLEGLRTLNTDLVEEEV
jgi:dTMP kinase